MVVVVGEGTDGATDLFAAPAGGGSFIRLTFTRQGEELPRLAPDGRRVAFLRRYDSTTVELAVLDLETMGEVRVRLPVAIGHPEHLGWAPSADTVVIADAGGFFAVALAKSPVVIEPVAAAATARADSLSREWLGDPIFAAIRPCRAGAGFCAIADTTETALGSQVRDPIRWGAAAVAYVRDGRIAIRPLGGGSASHPVWSEAPDHLRQPTHHPGRTGHS